MDNSKIHSLLIKYGIPEDKIRNMEGYFQKRLKERIGEQVLLAVGEDGIKQVQEIAEKSHLRRDEAIAKYLSDQPVKMEQLKSSLQIVHQKLWEEYFTEIFEAVESQDLPKLKEELSQLL